MSRSLARALTRKQALGVALATGGATAGGMLLGGPFPAGSRLASSGATSALNEILRLERIQAAFYAEARSAGALQGELATLATTLADQERQHVAELRSILGADADPPPRLRFGRATRDPKAFSSAARDLEDLAARSYNVQAPALSGRALRAVLRIVSVEARHAAWIRDLRGELPAPDAVEPGVSSAQVRAALNRKGFVR
jgi:rubrerythrin